MWCVQTIVEFSLCNDLNYTSIIKMTISTRNSMGSNGIGTNSMSNAIEIVRGKIEYYLWLYECY